MLIYIREAHPSNGWMVPQNQQQGIFIADPTTEAQRAEIAGSCSTKLHLTWPTLVDSMDDAVNKAYAAWPDRFYVIGEDGRIVFKGEPGPKGFRTNELEAFLIRALRR